jgi:hypothetical protein
MPNEMVLGKLESYYDINVIMEHTLPGSFPLLRAITKPSKIVGDKSKGRTSFKTGQISFGVFYWAASLLEGEYLPKSVLPCYYSI